MFARGGYVINRKVILCNRWEISLGFFIWAENDFCLVSQDRHANEQLRQSLLGAQENISELIKLGKEDEIVYLQQLKNYQVPYINEQTPRVFDEI